MRVSVWFEHLFCAAVLALVFLIGPLHSHAAHAGTLDDVRKRGHVACGVTEGTPGLSAADDGGNWSGLGADYCRALGAAIFGRKDAVKFSALNAADRLKALNSGAVDVLAGTTPWTLSFDSDLGIRFAGVLFYDGEAFLVRRADAFSSVFELSGATVCVTTGTSAEQSLGDFFRSRQMKYQIVVADRWTDVVKAYNANSCTVLTGDMSALAYQRSLMGRPSDHILLPEIVSKEPLGPAVRVGDEQWFAIVRWTLMALLTAEELGVGSGNAETMLKSPVLDVKRLLGVEGNLGGSLGLPQDWAYQAIRYVGNYGEMFDRSFGPKSPMRLDRGFNDLWTRGGLMFPAPIR